MVGWRRFLRVPWITRRSNQSMLKEISPEYSLEGLMLKLELQYFATWCEELIHLKRPWCWERLKAGEGDNWGWDGWMASPTRWTWVWASGSWWWTGQGSLACISPWGHKELDMTEWLNWTELKTEIYNSPVDFPSSPRTERSNGLGSESLTARSTCCLGQITLPLRPMKKE